MISCVFPNLLFLMSEKRISVYDIAKVIGKASTSVRNKLAGETSFNLDECIKIRDTYSPKMNIEELFKKSKWVEN